MSGEPERQAPAPLAQGAVSGTDCAKKGAAKTCPSSPCEEGALLIGVMTDSGRLAYIHPAPEVDAEFVASAKAAGRPQRRYRFSAPCVEADCPQWAGDHCWLGEQIAAQAEKVECGEPGKLPACAIRGACRWYAEQGARACAVCPLIVADTGATGTYVRPGGIER